MNSSRVGTRQKCVSDYKVKKSTEEIMPKFVSTYLVEKENERKGCESPSLFPL